MFGVTDNTLEVEYSNTFTSAPSREGNLFYTALINAEARIYMYKIIQNLEADGANLLYVDTDAVCYSAPKGHKPPFDVTPAFGDFKPVLGDAKITQFKSLGPRNYAIIYESAVQN